MIRLVLTQLAFFLAPFAVYWVYLRVRSAPPGTGWERDPVLVLAIAGSVVSVLGFVLLTDFRTNAPNENYIPPRFEDGRVIPGRFEPVPDAR